MASLWSVRRSVDDAKVAGLCGGVARHWGIDPVLVRVGWVLLTLSGGLGLVLYVAGWLMIPADGQTRSTLDDLTGGSSARWSREARLAVVVIACIVVFAVTGSISPFGFGPAVVLALIWYFGYYRNRRRQPAASPDRSSPGRPETSDRPAVEAPFRYPGPATPFTEAAEAWQRRMAEHLGQPVPPPAAPESAADYSAAQPPRWPTMPLSVTSPAGEPSAVQDLVTEPAEDLRHAAYLSTADPVGLYGDSDTVALAAAALPGRRARAQAPAARRLRLVSLIVLGLTLSGLSLANALGAHVPALAFLAAGLLVIGLTLIASTWVGRARGILPFGILVAVALLTVGIASPGGVPRDWSRTSAYGTVAELPRTGDDFDIGVFTVDLSRLALTQDLTYTAHVDVGRLLVRSPAGVNVRVRYRVDQGVAVVDGEPVASGTRQGVVEPKSALAGRPTLTLDLSADVGEVRVDR